MKDPLALLLHDGVIDEVVARLKSGKEADLWLVRHGGEVVVAKVYKARQIRSFKNNAGYKEGREVRDTRTRRAMARGSRFGQAAAEEAWKAKEADALHTLHAARVRVPRPMMFYEGVLLMEVVVDAHGQPAARLVDAHVRREEAAALYADLRGQAVRMLTQDLIHGDLSPYNVLLGRNGPVIIDFPQVVGAAHNSQAETFFIRDLENLRRFFAALDPALHARSGDAREIWRAYVRRELPPDFVPTGRGAELPHRHEHRSPAGPPRHAAAPVAPGRHPRPDARGEPHRAAMPGRPGKPSLSRSYPNRGPRGGGAPEVIHLSRSYGSLSGPPRTPPGRSQEAAPTTGLHGSPPPLANAPGGRRRRRRWRRSRGKNQ